jgi:hypothetical protein
MGVAELAVESSTDIVVATIAATAITPISNMAPTTASSIGSALLAAAGGRDAVAGCACSA